MIPIEEMAAFCKKKGFIYPSCEIYNSMAGFFDYGPYGVEVKNNIKQSWWEAHVTRREDIVGIDGSIISPKKLWKASGHLDNFADMMLTCSKCKNKIRADQYIEEQINQNVEGFKAEEINKIVKDNNLRCPSCKSEFQEVRNFNLMFSTQVGPEDNESATAFLRPETAQIIFANFKLVMDNARLKLPFGIAQIGRAFRNEISPRNFVFRCREFEQMEIEYFVHPKKSKDCPFFEKYKDMEVQLLSAEQQGKDGKEQALKLGDAVKDKIIRNPWHAFFIGMDIEWFASLGADPKNFRARQHLKTEKSHYAEDTWDLEYNFPFGWKELEGFANRTDFDLKSHIEHSKKDLTYYDEELKEKVVPHVVCEPSMGVDRAFLVFMYEAYTDDGRGNITLKFSPKMAPVKAAVFPLVNKLNDKAREIFDSIDPSVAKVYDKGGSVGRRYARADELGIPYCITVDFESLEDNCVTVRDRDSTEQKRIKIDQLNTVLCELINGWKSFKEI